MATVRISTKEVQVDDTVYVFDVVQIADAFEACVATADAVHCELNHRPVAKHAVGGDVFTQDQGGIEKSSAPSSVARSSG